MDWNTRNLCSVVGYYMRNLSVQAEPGHPVPSE